MTVCPAKTQISLGIPPVWSESSLCAQWITKDPSFLHADGAHAILLVLSQCSSFEYFQKSGFWFSFPSFSVTTSTQIYVQVYSVKHNTGWYDLNCNEETMACYLAKQSTLQVTHTNECSRNSQVLKDQVHTEYFPELSTLEFLADLQVLVVDLIFHKSIWRTFAKFHLTSSLHSKVLGVFSWLLKQSSQSDRAK